MRSRHLLLLSGLLFGLIVTVPLTGDLVKPAEPIEFWMESGMSKTLLREQVSTKKCGSSAIYRKSCQSAMDEARKYLDANKINWDQEIDAVVDQIDQLEETKIPKPMLYGNMFNVSLHEFDAHAMFGPSRAFENFLGSENSSHFGLGIVALATDAGLMIHVVYPGSPAQVAGLKVHDRLVKVNGQEIGVGLEISKHAELMAAKPGAKLLFMVERDGKSLEIEVAIGEVKGENVTLEIVEHAGQRFASIRVQRFKAETCNEMKAALRSLDSQVRGIILDLRDNPGGRMAEGVCVAGLFVGHKIIVGEKAVPITVPIEVGPAPFVAFAGVGWHISDEEPLCPDLPVMVLIDQLSASAAEIVAAALQDYERAWVVGELSFGKGSVQTVRDFDLNNNFKIVFTTALFYRPNGDSNQLAGVYPDYSVPFRFGATEAERRSPRERERFANALRPEIQASATAPSRAAREPLRACVSEDGRLNSVMARFKSQYAPADYQKAYALALLECSSPQHNSSQIADR